MDWREEAAEFTRSFFDNGLIRRTGSQGGFAG